MLLRQSIMHTNKNNILASFCIDTNTIGHVNIGIVFLFIWNSQWYLYNTQSNLAVQHSVKNITSWLVDFVNYWEGNFEQQHAQ